jgi:pentatricopeptide repeat protein
VGLLNACAGVGALEDGRRVHGQIIQRGCELEVFLANSLVDMYAKCGSMDDALKVFNMMPSRNVVTWTAILGACAMHGHGKEALKHFEWDVKKVCSQMIPLLFVFCQLVAMQVWWMKACDAMLQ